MLIHVEPPPPGSLKVIKADLAGYEKYEKKEGHPHVVAIYLRNLIEKIEKKK